MTQGGNVSKDKQDKQAEALPVPEVEPPKKETHDLLISPSRREKAEAEDENIEAELAAEDQFKTGRGDGHTHNPRQALDQGLTYTPPTDPATLPAEDDPQGVKVAAGFAPSMEDSKPSAERLPITVDNNDLDLQEDIYTALGNNSETGHLTNIKVQVEAGIVNLIGTVTTQDDIPRVYNIVSELDGVVEVQNNLQVEQ